VDFNRYVIEELPYQIGGRSRDGIDCWGLVWLFYKEQMGIEIPKYDDPYQTKSDYDLALYLMRCKKTNWQKVDEPQNGDVVLAKDMSHPIHVGIYKERNKMLNIRAQGTPVIEPLDGMEWKHNLLGFYRWMK